MALTRSFVLTLAVVVSVFVVQATAAPAASPKSKPAVATKESKGTDTTPQVGKAKPTWSKLTGVDGKEHSLEDFKDRDLVVIAVTCNHCPIALEYYERLKEFAKTRCGDDKKIGLIAISVSDMETDKLPRMKQLAERMELNFPYVYDGSQASAKGLGASVTPQFFVLDQNRVLAYRGAWDDSVNATKVKERYVEAAVDALLLGKDPLVNETKATGCLVTYKDEKK